MGSSDWAELPKHLLDSVVKRLPSASDYLRFSTVCTSWNSVAKHNLINKRIAPMLLAYSGKEETWNLCDITCDKVLSQLELPNKRYFGFSKGWLITMDENFMVTLINPFSRVKGRRAKENSIISLPALSVDDKTKTLWANRCKENYVFRATISADPISNAKDCVVAVLHAYRGQIAFIRLDKDTAWTYIDEEITNLQDIVYVEDRFFVVNILNQLFSFAVTPHFNPDKDVATASHFFDQEENNVKRYLVESSDRKDLLMVHRYLGNKNGQHGKRFTIKFEIFKLDDKHRWTKINSLGDATLFLGENSSISILASEVLGCLPDCIYFLYDYDLVPRPRPRDSGLYNIKTAKFLPIDHTDAATLIKMSNQLPIWTTLPNIKL